MCASFAIFNLLEIKRVKIIIIHSVPKQHSILKSLKLILGVKFTSIFSLAKLKVHILCMIVNAVHFKGVAGKECMHISLKIIVDNQSN